MTLNDNACIEKERAIRGPVSRSRSPRTSCGILPALQFAAND